MAKYKFTAPGGMVKGLFADMLKQTHLLIAGASGSGKSVLINGLICAGLHYFPGDQPGGVEFVFLDAKRTELWAYRNVPHCLAYGSEPEEMALVLQKVLRLIDERYKKMQAAGMLKYGGSAVYVIIDELADMMTTNKRLYQPLIQRIAQIGRAANVHLITATQTPLREVIPTTIKCNYDGIVALRTRNDQDSRNIIGKAGAENLPRYGECLYHTPEFGNNIYQYTIPYTTDAEKAALVEHWTRQYEKKKNGILRRIIRLFTEV